MRLLWPKIYYYDFDYYLFYKDEYPLKVKVKTGDGTLKNEFRLQFFCLSKYVEICRIRGPPSFDLKEFLSQREKLMNTLPKRRRKKDNPYTLLYESDSNKYFVLFKDARGVLNKVEVSNIIYNAFNRFELEDISELHKIDKHIDMNPLDEEKYYKINNESSETNRKIVDIISDVNLAYSEHARKYLHECGLPKERIYVTGSPMAEVLHNNIEDIKKSDILERLNLKKIIIFYYLHIEKIILIQKKILKVYLMLLIRWLKNIICQYYIHVILEVERD